MTPVVRFDDVQLIYPGPPPVEALKPARLRIEDGEYVVVVGPSGSGKSSLLNLVGLLDRPTSGTYELAGVDVGLVGDAERTGIRARWVGFVFQSFHLLPFRTAVENVTLAQLYTGVSASSRRRNAVEALSKVGLSHRLHALPSTMSGGEKQRVAIARALVNEPRLLLCDEPTGNLDSATAESVLQLLDDVHASGYTVIVITHDPRVAARGQRLLTIKDGVVHG